MGCPPRHLMLSLRLARLREPRDVLSLVPVLGARSPAKEPSTQSHLAIPHHVLLMWKWLMCFPLLQSLHSTDEETVGESEIFFPSWHPWVLGPLPIHIYIPTCSSLLPGPEPGLQEWRGSQRHAPSMMKGSPLP